MAKKGKKKAAKEKIGVAERKRAEEEIGKLAKFPSENPNPVLRVAKDGTILYANKASSPLLNIWGSQIGQLLPNYLCKTISDAFSSGSSKDTEVECEDRAFSLTIAPVVDAGYANLYGLDITEHKRAEEMLRQSREKLKMTIESSPDAITVTDLKGNITECNQITLDLHGFSTKEELIGKSAFGIISPKDRERALENMKKTLKQGSVKNLEYTFLTKDGHEFPAELSASVILDSSGKPTAFVAITKNITERKRAEEARHKAHNELEVRVAERTEELSQANIRLKGLDKLKSMFMASMSHELRTPLNSIIGFTGVMLQGIAGEITEEQRKQLTIVKNSSNHLLSMITDIIDLNKIEAGKIEVLIKETDIAKTIDEVLATFADKIRKKGLALKKNIPKKLIISTDEKRFKQILINLLDNAVKFTVEGSIKVYCRVKGEEIEISVKDTGPGIREEGIEELFRPFAQVDYEFKVKYGGPGIGLYLSKRIVELLGGKIWAESEFGKGSRFTFVLPIKGAKT